jgi:hypothetical protein
MKNFKSLILGSAAGLLAVAGAQAADLPVKAKPAEYVKVCSAYGAGFYYIPGTDICLRVGGYIYSEFQVNDQGHGESATVGTRNRDVDWTSWRIRQALILDARTNTEYGTLRSYFSGGFQWDTNLNGQSQSQSADAPGNWRWYYNAAFIQFAGFTFGLANSFFEFGSSWLYNSAPGYMSPKTPPLIAYTAQFGNGLSASISVEDATARRKFITSNATPATGSTSDGYAAQFMPDIIGNLRVDQGWGAAQISGAVHQVITSNGAGVPLASEKYGYAFLGGLEFKLPQLGAGDSFQVSGAWAKGAVGFNDPDASNYTSNGTKLSYLLNGSTAPNLPMFDGNVSGGNLELTKSYSVDVEYRHFWTPNLRSAIAWVRYHQDSPSTANATFAPDGTFDTVAANLIWSPVKNLDLGTEVYWANLKTENGPVALNGSESWWGGVFKATRYW